MSVAGGLLTGSRHRTELEHPRLKMNNKEAVVSEQVAQEALELSWDAKSLSRVEDSLERSDPLLAEMINACIAAATGRIAVHAGGVIRREVPLIGIELATVAYCVHQAVTRAYAEFLPDYPGCDVSQAPVMSTRVRDDTLAAHAGTVSIKWLKDLRQSEPNVALLIETLVELIGRWHCLEGKPLPKSLRTAVGYEAAWLGWTVWCALKCAYGQIVDSAFEPVSLRGCLVGTGTKMARVSVRRSLGSDPRRARRTA